MLILLKYKHKNQSSNEIHAIFRFIFLNHFPAENFYKIFREKKNPVWLKLVNKIH